MLIKPDGTRTKAFKALTLAETQVLVNFEPFLLGIGLAFELLCIPCRLMKRPAVCNGGHDYDESIGADVFTIECGCTKREYRGSDLVVPTMPHWTRRGDDLLKYKRTRNISRAQMAVFDEFGKLAASLKLQYGLRCLQCRIDGAPEGVTGVHESTAMQTVMECACTKRVYASADAPATVH